jgi:pimeloyl-ACP methyl ester carboxylesterase
MDPTTTTQLIRLENYSINVYTTGVAPSQTSPTALIIPGLASSHLSFAGVLRLLSPHLQILTYDRYPHIFSSYPPLPPTAENIASQLSLLLQAAKIGGPLILVAHSWGGIIAREFLEVNLKEKANGKGMDVAGLVLIDANQENTLKVLDWRDENLRAMAEGVDFLTVTGIGEEHKMSCEAWDAFRREEEGERHRHQSKLEEAEYEASFATLAEKKQLERVGKEKIMGDRPVCVIMGSARRDAERIYKAGMKRGNGTEVQRRKARELLDGWDEKDVVLQSGNLGLSNKGKLIKAIQSGHFVQITEPQILVDGVNWVLSEYLHQESEAGKRIVIIRYIN